MVKKNLIICIAILIILSGCLKNDKYPFQGKVLSRYYGCATYDEAGPASMYVIQFKKINGDNKLDTITVFNLPKHIDIGDQIKFNYRPVSEIEYARILCFSGGPISHFKTFTEIEKEPSSP